MEDKKSFNRYFAYLIIVALSIAIVFLIDLLLQYPFFNNIKEALFTVFFPFLTSFFIVYIFHPVLYWFEKRFSIRTWVSTLILLFINIILLITLIEFLIPILRDQFINIFNELPNYINQFEKLMHELQERYHFLDNDKFTEILETIIDNFSKKLGEMLINFTIGFVLFLVRNLWIIIMIPIIVFMMMKDYSIGYEALNKALGKHRKSQWMVLVKNIDEKLGNYVRGELILMGHVFLGNLALLSIAGMPNPLIFALILAITTIIPYIGILLGGIPLWIYAYFQSPYLFIVSLFIVLLSHLSDVYIGQVLIFEKQLKIHPLIIMMLMLIGGAIAGIVGILFVIPIFIVLREIYKYYKPYIFKSKKASS